jgi:pimeloyl-ACP methyl ester carboxylesterase
VAANGARFHLVEAGTGPLVLLLHGFPEFWWAWRHQLPALADAGFHAVAMDLRGYGGSDMTPRGYDPFTLAADVAGVVRALGAPRATLVGHGIGGFVGWSTAVLQAPFVERLGVVSARHPRHARTGGSRRLVGLSATLEFQLPRLPERRLIADDGAWVGQLLDRWSAPGWPDAETSARYREAMLIWPAPHCALEYLRWLVRSSIRTDGRRFAARMREPVRVPVLNLYGGLDRLIASSDARDDRQYMQAPYRSVELAGAGHFPHEEAPERFTQELLGWLAEKDA